MEAASLRDDWEDGNNEGEDVLEARDAELAEGDYEHLADVADGAHERLADVLALNVKRLLQNSDVEATHTGSSNTLDQRNPRI